MYGGVFTFAGGLETGVEGRTQILHVNVHHVASFQVGEGITSPHHLQYSIPVPTFSSAVRCFELSGGMF